MAKNSLRIIRTIWDSTMSTMKHNANSTEVAYLWSEADLEHRIGEGILSNFSEVQTHHRASLDPDLFDDPLSSSLRKFWVAYREKYPGARKVYPDLLVQKAWDVSDPFILGGEIKFYQTSNYFNIASLVKDLDRLTLLDRHGVCTDVAMMVANGAPDGGLDPDDLRDVTKVLDRYQARGLEILRYRC